jgi:peptidyl-Lys metalloendopeptidase
MIGTLADLKFQFRVTNHSKETITLVRDPSGILSDRYRTEKFIVTTSNGKNAQPHFRGIRIKWSPEKAAELGDTIVIAPGQGTHSVIEHDCEQRQQKQSIVN